ncbi:PLP-dependent aminotransferase family protein [Paenibacillus sp. NEAU-GSW1]|uniref:MocR-like pyridoxine biosynthesis transcription factor PdxR n=1 Tax=Paenibacillus sp. NEAU-GSW1 TaxID=2682486 RepID=UPI0020A64B58|nr:PLP-dependent aminotransferase family protein [Paenibacillus sp. NEAU-GSW1]
MHVLLDPALKKPIFQQIADHIENQIVSGELAAGSKLPTERFLASSLRVHRTTVTKAYDELRANGFIVSKQGSGNYVRGDLWEMPGSSSWRQYIQSGALRPTLPMMQQLRDFSQDPHYINFADGELAEELLPNTMLSELLRQYPLNRWLGYSNHLGELYLRQTLSKHLQDEYGIKAAPDQILVTSGSQQSLHLITQSLLSYGDCVGIEGPSYFYAQPLFQSAGIRLIRLPSDEEGILPEAVSDLHKRYRLKMLILTPTYHNPTGTVLPLSRRLRLLELSRALNIPIVEDDVYGPIRLDGAPPPPPLNVLSSADNVTLYLGSLSKTAASGIRLGWIVGAVPVIERLADVKQQVDFGASTLLQQIADVFFTSGAWGEHLSRIRSEVTRNRDTMAEALRTYCGDDLEWNLPQGGFHFWCKVKGEVRDSELFEQAIRQQVIYVPGSLYGAEQGHIRLSYSRVNRDEIVEGIRRLGETLRKLAKNS